MKCVIGVLSNIDQILHLLKSLTDQEYAEPLELFNGSTMGQHVRHIFDFYNTVLKGSVVGVVDYASRERNPRIEIDTMFTIKSFQSMKESMIDLNESEQLSAISDFNGEEEGGRVEVISSVGRELMYAFDHSIHHLAIIKMGAKVHFPDVVLEDSLGIAPSTKRYQSAQSSKQSE